MDHVIDGQNSLYSASNPIENKVALFDNRIDSESSKEWLNTDEAARYLALSAGALRNMTSNGNIPYYKLGRRNRYRIDDLRDLLFNNKKGGSYGL